MTLKNIIELEKIVNSELTSKVDNSDRNILREAGFSEEEILEIVEVASFFNMSNRIAAGTDMRPNAEYHNMGRE